MTCEEELERIKDGIRKYLDGDAGFVVSNPWRDDGVPSKHDKCEHDHYRWEGCTSCIDTYLEDLIRE